HLAAAGFPLDDLAALLGIFRTLDAGGLVLDVLAVGILGARGELAEPTLFDDQVRAAARARLVQDLIRLGGFQPALLRGNQLPRRFPLGVAGAGEALA